MASSKRYTPPPKPETDRRVYVLPTAMVDAICAYGKDTRCRSEVEAVRALLDAQLKRLGY